MPKSFSETEKENIRKSLIEACKKSVQNMENSLLAPMPNGMIT